MAMTAAERKRRQIQRERDRAKQQPDPVYSLPRPQFGAWLNENDAVVDTMHLAICYDGMNRMPPDFHDEGDPVSATGGFVFPTTAAGEPSYRGALGRAELEVELLIEAAKTLAGMINAYKRAVLESRIAEIETRELDDPTTRGARLKEIIDLNTALERLNKSVRAELPQWELRG